MYKILVLIIPLFLVLLWFSSGNLMAAGESGLSFYDTSWNFKSTDYAIKPTALGNVNNITVASAPTYWLFSQLHALGIPEFAVQALFFWFILTSSGIGIYLLNKILFPELADRYTFLAVLFYWFNPISLVNIWSRFLYNFMVFFGLLPVASYFFIKGLQEKKLIYAIIFGVITGIYSFALTSTPFIILLWALVVYTWFLFLVRDKASSIKFKVIYLLLCLMMFILINFWWISQMVSFLYSSAATVVITDYFNINDNLNTLTALSVRLGLLSNIFRFMHITFYYDKSRWLQIFEIFPTVAAEFFFSGIILWTIYKYRYLRSVIYLSSLFLFGLFLMKGNNPPFGELFQIAFVKFSVLQVFRNPFEKFGFIVLFAGSQLFSLSVYQLTKTFNKYTNKIYIITLVWLIVIWGFPFWSGLVFKTQDSSGDKLVTYQIKVPEYYNEINKWLKTNILDARFIQFPIGGEGMTYDWPLSYSGVDLSPTLFEIPNISFNTSIPYYDKVVSKLEQLFMQKNDFYKIAALLNSKYIVTRSDVDWRERNLTNPELITDRLNEINYPKVNSFGKLNVYQIEGTPSALIYPGKNGILVTPDVQIDDFLTAGGEVGDYMFSKKSSLPVSKILVKPLKEVDLDTFDLRGNIIDSLLHVEHLPNDKLYPLVLAKEKLERSQLDNSDDIALYDLTHLGKRVVEINKLAENNADPGLIDNYFQKYLDSLASFIKDDYYPLINVTKEELTKQQIVLKKTLVNINKNYKDQFNLKLNKLNQILIDQGVDTIYPISSQLNQENASLRVARYSVPEDGTYKLVLQDDNWNDYYTSFPDNFQLQIDGKVMTLKGQLKGEDIDFGEINFKTGLHEIVFAKPLSKNLLVSKDDIILNSANNAEVTLNMSSFDPYADYNISFDSLILQGESYNLFAKFDNDIKNDGKLIPGYNREITSDAYYRDFYNQKITITPRKGATSMSLGFIAQTLNLCSEQTVPFPESCNDPNYKKQFDKVTTVSLRNISLEKVFNNQLFLIKDNNYKNETQTHVSFKEITPSEYQVSVNNLSDSFVLVFSDLFNPDWKVGYEDGSLIPENKHLFVNGYANAWLIDRTGKFNLELKFMPQDLLDFSKIISVATFVCSILVIGGLWIRKK